MESRDSETKSSRRKTLCEGSGISLSGLRMAVSKNFRGRLVECPHCGEWVDHFQKLGVWQDVVFLEQHYIEEEPVKIRYEVHVEVDNDEVEVFDGTAEVSEGDTIRLYLDASNEAKLPAKLQDAITEEVYEQLRGLRQEYLALFERVHVVEEDVTNLKRQLPASSTSTLNYCYSRIGAIQNVLNSLTEKHNELASDVNSYQNEAELARGTVRSEIKTLTKRINDVNFDFVKNKVSNNQRLEALEKPQQVEDESHKELGMSIRFANIGIILNRLRGEDYGISVNLELARLHDAVQAAQRYYTEHYQ